MMADMECIIMGIIIHYYHTWYLWFFILALPPMLKKTKEWWLVVDECVAEGAIDQALLFVCFQIQRPKFSKFYQCVCVCVFLKKKGHGTKPVFYTHGSDQYHFCIGNFYMERERENKIKFLIRMVGNTPKTIIIIFL